MTTTLHCTIPLRPRSWTRNTHGFHRPKADTDWLNAAVMFLRKAARLQQWGSASKPVRLRLRQVLARPARRPRLQHKGRVVYEVSPKQWATGDALYAPSMTGPDIDRLQGLVLDALVKADVLLDDGQVVRIDAAKMWAAKGEQPCTRIELTEQWIAYPD